jgi:hypothetical protein
MKSKKRILSMVLTLAMVISMVPVFGMSVSANPANVQAIILQLRIAFGELEHSNNTTLDQFNELIAPTIEELAIVGTANITGWERVNALPGVAGSITGTLNVSSGGSDGTHQINFTIPALPFPSLVEHMLGAGGGLLSGVKPSTTTPDDILNSVLAILAEAAATDPTLAAGEAHWADTPTFVPPSIDTTGSITGGITVRFGNINRAFTVSVGLEALPNWQSWLNQHAAAAHGRVRVVDWSDAEESAATQADVMEVVNDGLPAGITATWDSGTFQFAPSEPGIAGNIRGTLVFTMENPDFGTASQPEFLTATEHLNIHLTGEPVPGAFYWNPVTETISGPLTGSPLLYAIIRPRLDRNIANEAERIEDGIDAMQWNRVRWFPLEGDLNLGRIIPRRPGTFAFVAVRDATEAMGMASVTTLGVIPAIQHRTDDVRVAQFNGRAPFPRGTVAWNPQAANGAGALAGALPRDAANAATITTIPVYNFNPAATHANFRDEATHAGQARHFAYLVGRAGVNGWNSTSVGLNQARFPMGTQLEIREILLDDRAIQVNPTTVVNASPTTLHNWFEDAVTIAPTTAPLRLRVPAIPAAPRIRLPVLAAGNVNLRNTMEYVVLTAAQVEALYYGQAGHAWTRGAGANVSVSSLVGYASGNYLVIRVAADVRRPNSFYQVIRLP